MILQSQPVTRSCGCVEVVQFISTDTLRFFELTPCPKHNPAVLQSLEKQKGKR